MASILDRYGIKEVADVTFYKIDESGNRGAPVLFLDTLKVSTIEQTASSADAKGGKGNPTLISWDFGKEISVAIEDALFSPKSMNLMYGSLEDGNLKWGSATIDRTVKFGEVKAKTTAETGKYLFKVKGSYVEATEVKFYTAAGAEVTATGGTVPDSFDYAVGTLASNKQSIEISADTFPGTYYITGDTYARSETTGEDQFFQFIIRKAKVQAENTITLQAEGDPSVFSMNLKVLRPSSGPMMELVQYDLANPS